MVADGSPVELVWHNELGGLTYRICGAGTYVKWAPIDTDVDLGGEARRMAWAGRWTPVPAVIDAGSDDDGSWLVTEAVDAPSAVDPRWLAEPRTTVIAVGEGLRALHDSLPVDTCLWAGPLRTV